jgi:catechol 2,3-dioxygenase-like lactoylglutathione lyase family enzyme
LKSTFAHPLRALVKEARNIPGVYRMLGEDGEVLYVGKSKSLRTRLLSYLRARRGDKQHRIINECHTLAWDYEPSEFAALLRELELIKRFRPRLNVQHKRDGRWSFLKLAPGAAPRLYVVQTVSDDAAGYYGPFRGGKRVSEAVRELNDALGLRDCPQGTPMRFADQPDLQIGLLPPEMGRSEGDAAALRGLLAKGVLSAPIFRCDDIDAEFARISAAGAEVLQEPIDQPYGVRDCAFRDPAGNLLRIQASA